MENYRLLQRLGKGAQGSVYLAEHRQEQGRKCVLKQIECNDESEANKAFKEALALQKLQHPYICGYKEFFVTWDKEISAMFVCIVMDHYPNGDLATVLRQKRQSLQLLDEQVIKKWLGQLVEALIFIHKKKVIHRDLKPSNIFLNADQTICIGDFGVATVMADVRTKTRVTVGSMNWMAPEVLERAYDERSDVWSAGCIALELATCGLLDPLEMTGKLLEIKHNTEALDEILAQLGESYSEDLVSVIRKMLQRNHEERPDTKELCRDAYIQECLVLSNTIMTEKQKRTQSAAAKRPLPANQGLEAVISYLEENLDNEVCVKQALEEVAELSKDEAVSMDTRGKRLLAHVMRDYMTEPDIQIWAATIFSNLIITANVDDVLYSQDIVSVIPQAMKAHQDCAELQQVAAGLMVSLSADEGAAEVLGFQGGIDALLEAMRTFPDNASLCTTCCNALWSLTVNEDNMRLATEQQGINDVVGAMTTHDDCPELIEAACACIMSLSMEDENLDAVNKLDCVGLILDAVEGHGKEAKVVKNACMALAAMVEPDEESAYKLLANPRAGGAEVQGIPVLIKAYEQHKDNAEVVENICVLIMELIEYDEICAEVRHLRLGDRMLTEIHKRFKDNADIMAPCEAALSKLGVTKIQFRHLGVKNKSTTK